MPKLTKLEVEQGKTSFIEAGQVHTLPWISLFKHDDKDAKKEVNSVDDIEEGWQIFMSSAGQWMNTSKIREIVSKTDTTITFYTQTSLYRLEMEGE